MGTAMPQVVVNDNLVLICGDSAAGKSSSFMNIDDHAGVMYLNCEAGKKLPFKNKFKSTVITDPSYALAAFDWAEQMPEIHTIVVESLNLLMAMYYSVNVRTSTNTMTAWGDYAEYFNELMQQKVAKSTKNVFFSAHLESVLNEKEGVMEKKVPIKGQHKGTGVEAYFSVIVGAKKITLKDLEPYGNDLLVISEMDKILGYKHVFQTMPTKDTIHERIRAPMQMWDIKETYINNDAQLLINRLREYYA